MTHKPTISPRRVASLAVLLALALTAACSRHSSLFATVSPDAKPPVSMVAVLQSDVLVIDDNAVRLADVVTPQASPHARCTAEALAARQTRQRLQDLAARAHTVSMTPTGEKDTDGLPYAHVQLDGADPARDLIADGLAVRPGKAVFSWCGPIGGDWPRAEHIAALSRGNADKTTSPPAAIPR